LCTVSVFVVTEESSFFGLWGDPHANKLAKQAQKGESGSFIMSRMV
jgi:hypothetical protein